MALTTQEAHRPPRSKCSLCCSVQWGGGLEMGYPPPDMGYPPGHGVPPQTWVPPGHGVPPSDLRWGTPARKCEQTEKITFPHPSDAGGNKIELGKTIGQFGVAKPLGMVGRALRRLKSDLMWACSPHVGISTLKCGHSHLIWTFPPCVDMLTSNRHIHLMWEKFPKNTRTKPIPSTRQSSCVNARGIQPAA